MRVALNSFLLRGRAAAPKTWLIWEAAVSPEGVMLQEEKWGCRAGFCGEPACDNGKVPFPVPLLLHDIVLK